MRLFGFDITRRKAAVPAQGVSGWLGGWLGDIFPGSWQKGVTRDSTESVLACSAVYSCISLISKDIGKLSTRLMAYDEKAGIWQETENPAYSPVLRKPNRYQTRNLFWEQWIISKLVFGNTYVLKERDNRGVVVAMYVLNPMRCHPYVAPDGEVYYSLGGDNLAGIEEGMPYAPSSEIIHDRHTCLFHPLVGVPPLFAAGMSATQGNRIQANSAKFFENMSRPSGQLTAPGTITDATAARLKASFEGNFSGANIGRLLVAGDGLSFQPFVIPADQAQMIEQLKWTVEDATRPFAVPLYKIGAGQMPQIGNIGALNLEYYQQALQPLMENAESLMDEGLGLKNDICVEFDLEGLVRMDPKTRAETTEIQMRSAVITPNEARACENLPPVKGGDTPYMQQQNFSLAALAKRDASDDPFGKAPPAQPKPQEPQAANDPNISEESAQAATKAFEEALAA